MRNYRHIQIEPLTPAIGAEVFGVDLAAGMSEDVLDEIYSALIDHHVIFMKGQAITVGDHLKFA